MSLKNRNATKTIAAYSLFALALGSFHPQLVAQQVYRIVGADGKVTFSDKPPADPAKAKVTTGTGSRAGTDSANASLPLELREPANKYPVTLYTSNNCNPCAAGKAMLVARGVPFTERTVNTSEDAEALQRIAGDSSLPFLTIGGQQIKGFADVEWAQYLDAAGYPKTSLLPANFRGAPAAPLVASKRVEPATAATDAGAVQPAATAARRPARQAPAAATENTNPAGITF